MPDVPVVVEVPVISDPAAEAAANAATTAAVAASEAVAAIEEQKNEDEETALWLEEQFQEILNHLTELRAALTSLRETFASLLEGQIQLKDQMASLSLNQPVIVEKIPEPQTIPETTPEPEVVESANVEDLPAAEKPQKKKGNRFI